MSIRKLSCSMFSESGALHGSFRSAQMIPFSKLTCFMYTIMIGSLPSQQNHHALQQCRPNHWPKVTASFVVRLSVFHTSPHQQVFSGRGSKPSCNQRYLSEYCCQVWKSYVQPAPYWLYGLVIRYCSEV